MGLGILVKIELEEVVVRSFERPRPPHALIFQNSQVRASHLVRKVDLGDWLDLAVEN